MSQARHSFVFYRIRFNEKDTGMSVTSAVRSDPTLAISATLFS